MFTDVLDRLDKVNRREEDPRFYFVWHARLFSVLLVTLVLSCAVWIAVFYFSVARPEALTWAQTNDGKTVALFTVDEPQYTNAAIENWVETAVKSAYNYDFAHWEQQLSQARPYFSPEAWELFVAQLNKNIKPALEAKQMLVSVAVDKARIGENPRIVNGIVSWNVTVPAMISYTSSETKSEKVTFDITVARQLTYTNPKGLWITKFNEIR
jgi:hypothetical protein